MNEESQITTEKLDGEYRNVGLFIDNAKTYIQVATGALLLSVAFSEGLTGEEAIPLGSAFLWVSWLGWLITILSGVTYQYCAAKYLEELEIENQSLRYARPPAFTLFRFFIGNPYRLYGTMMSCFYVATNWFVAVAIFELCVANS